MHDPTVGRNLNQCACFLSELLPIIKNGDLPSSVQSQSLRWSCWGLGGSLHLLALLGEIHFWWRGKSSSADVVTSCCTRCQIKCVWQRFFFKGGREDSNHNTVPGRKEFGLFFRWFLAGWFGFGFGLVVGWFVFCFLCLPVCFSNRHSSGCSGEFQHCKGDEWMN